MVNPTRRAPDSGPAAEGGPARDARRRLQRSQRLRRRPEFDHVFEHRRSAADHWLVVYGRENGQAGARLGVIVSRRVGGAVLRNRWKRLLREAFRLSQYELPPGIDLVAIARGGVTPQLPRLKTSLIRLSHRVAAKDRGTSP